MRLLRDARGVLTLELGSNPAAIVRALETVAGDARNKVVILRGLERELALGAGATNAVLAALARLPTPVIAVVEGDAHAHPEIALTADVVIAGANATFGYAAPPSSRAAADDAIRALWRRRIGREPAEAFLWSPWPLSAARAHAWTLVSEVVEAGAALRRAKALAALYLAVSEATRRWLRADFIAPVQRRLAQPGRGVGALQARAGLSDTAVACDIVDAA